MINRSSAHFMNAFIYHTLLRVYFSHIIEDCRNWNHQLNMIPSHAYACIILNHNTEIVQEVTSRELLLPVISTGERRQPCIVGGRVVFIIIHPHPPPSLLKENKGGSNVSFLIFFFGPNSQKLTPLALETNKILHLGSKSA